ncbi:MAG: class F sortase [Candidatus Saccharimonadales bacterium]
MNKQITGEARSGRGDYVYIRRPSQYHSGNRIQDIVPIKPEPVYAALPPTKPDFAGSNQSNTNVRKVRRALLGKKQAKWLQAIAIIILAFGVVAVLSNFLHSNHQVAAQAKQPSGQSNTSKSQPVAPSTTKPTVSSIADYQVGPKMPRYLDVSKLSVHARIMPLGVLANGALGAPGNVFDTGWYNQSSLPGQPGAMLIDGHVSSWTTRGVFYSIKNLVAGDKLQVQRGDGKIFTYKVVASKTYSANNVDMRAAVTPINSKKSGLNLISCSGSVIPGTSLFNKRIIVFAEQVSGS